MLVMGLIMRYDYLQLIRVPLKKRNPVVLEHPGFLNDSYPRQ